MYTAPKFAPGQRITSRVATGVVSRVYKAHSPAGIGPQWCYEIDQPEDGSARIQCVYERSDRVRLADAES